MALEKIGVEAVIDGLRAFNRGIDRMDDSVDKFGKTSEGVSAKTIALGNIMADLALGAAKLVTDAIIGIGKATVQLAVDSTKLASEFQDSLVVLQLSARDTGLSLEGLSDVALQVGGDTSLVGVSATGAAEAMTGLFKAGLDTTEVFGDLNGFMEGTAELGGALRASIDLAAASELDMVQASDLAAIALSTFGGDLETTEERAKFVNDAMNNFVQAADASVADVGDLAQALKNVGPTAASMGFSIEEVNNGLAILSTRGINGAEAGTQLKSVLLNMTRPTAKVKGVLDDLGVSLFDSTGTMKDMRTIIGDLQTGMEGLTQEQRNVAIQTLAGSFGQAGLNTLLAEGVEGWDAMADATANATTIQEQAFARTQTLSGQMEALDGVIETLKIQIGNAFLPVATEFIQWASIVAEDIGPKVVAFFENVAGFVRGLVTELGKGVSVWNAFVEAILNWTQVGESNFDLILNIVGAIETFVGSIRDAALPVLATLQNWFQQLLPIAIKVLTDLWNTVLVPIFTALKDDFENNLLPALQTLWTWLQSNIPGAIQTLSGFWDNILLPAIKTVVGFITDTVIPTLGIVRAWLIENIPVAIEALANIWRTVLLPALNTIWEFIQNNLIPIFETAVEWLKDNIPVAIEKLTDFWENKLLPAITAVWDFINSSLLPLFKDINDFISAVFGITIEVLAALWETRLKPALEEIWKFIKIFVLPIFKEVVAFLVEKTFPALNVFKIGLDKVKGALDVVAGAINTVRGFLRELTDLFNNMEVPDWLKPGSPPPLFFALKDISGAMRELARMAIPQLQAELGTLSFNQSAAMQPQFAASGGGTTSIDRSRSLSLEVNNSFANQPSITDRDELAFVLATVL